MLGPMAAGRKRPERTARRAQERDARKRVRDREKLAALSPGGARERPIEVASAAVIEGRAGSLACPQCGGPYRIRDHRSAGAGVRCVDVACRQCGAPRSLWFRIALDEPN
jgi:hypothetical protein